MIATCLECLDSAFQLPQFHNSGLSKISEDRLAHLNNSALSEVLESRNQKERSWKNTAVADYAVNQPARTGVCIVTDIESLSHSIAVTFRTTLAEFKKQVEKCFNVPPEKQCLMYNRKTIEVLLDEEKRKRLLRDDDVSWRDLCLPLDAKLQLLVQMISNDSVASSTSLAFNLCWDKKSDVKPVLQHLNAVCIAVAKDGVMSHVDFDQRYLGLDFSVLHKGKSKQRYASGPFRLQLFQTLEVSLRNVPMHIESLYFILCSVADMASFENTCIELIDKETQKVFDTYTKTGVSGKNTAMIMACAKRRRSGVGWVVLRAPPGEVCSGNVTTTRKNYTHMDITVAQLERGKFANV